MIGISEVLVGCMTIDLALWGLHAMAHASASTPVPPASLSSFLWTCRKHLVQLHAEHHKLGCVRTTLGAFYGEHLEHFLWTLVVGLAGRIAVGSWGSAGSLTALVTIVSVLVPSWSVVYLQHHYDFERGDRKVPGPFVWRRMRGVYLRMRRP